jgi:phosphatidylglycerophosphatase A
VALTTLRRVNRFETPEALPVPPQFRGHQLFPLSRFPAFRFVTFDEHHSPLARSRFWDWPNSSCAWDIWLRPWLALVRTAAVAAESLGIPKRNCAWSRATDPGSIVFDEIAAIPLCFVSWVLIMFARNGSFPAPSYFISSRCWLVALGVFLLFRIFDVWKPWPVRQSQHFPGGWGVTADDALAAVYVNLVVLAGWTVHRLTTQT